MASVALALLPTLFPGKALGQGTENDTKAEMLFNIAKFVQWPSMGTGEHRGQIVFTILGEDDLAGAITAIFSTRTINGREVFVRFVRRVEDVRGAQILYIASSKHEQIPNVLTTVRGQSVLTVADHAGFAAQGGMVNFVRQDDKVRFEINPASAERSRLKISAKLLTLAKLAQAQPE
jgi:hypothetical protein